MTEPSKSASKDSVVATQFGDITYKVIGAAMRVHNQLGPGLREVHYHEALSIELTKAGLAFEDEKPLQVTLADQQLGLLFLDHFVEGSVIVEEKALYHLLTDEEVAQVLTYLAVTEAPIALLINFGRQRLEYRRILPPRNFSEWRERAARYAWRPSGSGGIRPEVGPDAGHAQVSGEDSSAHPLIRSTSAYDSTTAVSPSANASSSLKADRADEPPSANPLIRSTSADDSPSASASREGART